MLSAALAGTVKRFYNSSHTTDLSEMMMMSEKSEAIANADAHLQNVGLPTYTEAVNALQLLYGTKYPFAATQHGGLGLPYTGENLLATAWSERDADADAAAITVLQKALGIQPVSVSS